MRDDLRRTCSDIWVIDCSPEGHQPDVPTRIFEGVQQPVCIVLAARRLGKDEKKPAHVRFRALPKGKREEKFNALAALSLDAKDWIDCPADWRAPFLPEVSGKWADFATASESILSIYIGRNGSANMADCAGRCLPHPTLGRVAFDRSPRDKEEVVRRRA